MKLIYRIFKIFAIFIIALVLISFTASYFMQNKVAGLVLKSLNKNISTKFTVGSARLSFIRKFPNASLDMKNVVVFSSPGFDKTGFTGINTDTLLSAGSVIAEFSIADIINGIYNIDRVGVRKGRLNLFSDTAGRVNYEISADTTEKESEFMINLDRVNVSEISATYFNLATKLAISGIIDEGRLRTRISGDKIDFTAKSSLRINLFRLYNFIIDKPLAAGIDVNLHSSAKGILFNKSMLKIEGYEFGLNGSFSSDDMLDLSLTGKNINISDIKKYLPEKHLEKISAYNPSGLLNISSKISGVLTRTLNPRIDINFTLSDGSVTYGSSLLTIKDLSFTGQFTNGSGMIPKTSSLAIMDFKGMLGSSQYSGSLVLSDFDSLNGDVRLNGKIIPSDLKEFFALKSLSSTSGTIDFNLKMNGYIPDKEKYSVSDLLSLNPDADIKFNSFGIGFKNDKIKVSNITGTVLVSDSVNTDNLSLDFKGHKIEFRGNVHNLPEWLSGKSVVLYISGDIISDRMLPDVLFGNQSGADTIRAGEKAFSLPEDIVLDLKYRIGELNYKTFSAENITGLVSYKPKLLNFKTLKLNSLEGAISGNGFVVQNPDKSFVGKGTFDFEKINVNKTFTSFNNFGQDFIRSENLAGLLSGSVSVLIPADSLLKPVIKSVTAEGKYQLENGALVDFEPVKELSSFIELSELENIHFENLENDFFIRNNILYIPQMDVRSSAADLSVNGKHSFDNNYEYHIKILLSEILSKKIRKPKPNTTEFGAIQDDGLGRTSILLKIANRGEDVKVTYDVKAAGKQIKNDIKSERQNLKTILNQEYGLFKKDTAANTGQKTGSPRFKITWDEPDTIKNEVEPPVVKQENPLKNLFKKR
jgi:hypothetical protein